MVNKWVIGLVISFILRQLAKFQAGIDWVKVKGDAALRVAALMPGTFFDAEMVAIAYALIDGAQAVLSSTSTWDQIMHLIANEKYKEALDVLVKLLLEQWKPDAQNIYGLKAQAILAKAA